MSRTKPADVTEKIIKAEQLRLRALRQNPLFRLDLESLEEAARNLPPAPSIIIRPKPPARPIPFRELVTEKNWRLPRRAEKLYRQWSETAEAFFDRWGFKPRLAQGGAVKLFIRSPVSVKLKRSRRSATWILDEERFSPGDVRDVRDHYARFLKERGTIIERRVNLKSLEQKAAALELAAEGKTPREIAKIIHPEKYDELVGKTINVKKLPPGEQREQYISAVIKHAENGASWLDAEKLAASELGIDTRSESTKTKRLTERTRHLLKKSRQK